MSDSHNLSRVEPFVGLDCIWCDEVMQAVHEFSYNTFTCDKFHNDPFRLTFQRQATVDGFIELVVTKAEFVNDDETLVVVRP